MITIKTSKGELELYGGDSISVSGALADIRDITDKSSMFSTSIKIPATPNNNNIFGYLYDVNVFTDVNVNKYIECVVSVDNIDGFEANLQIINTIEKAGDMYYDCNLLGKNNDIFAETNNNSIRDLDTSASDHTYSKVNIEGTWSSANNSYFYPYVEYGNYYTMDEIHNDAILDEADNYYFLPAYSAKYIFDKIWSESGFEYTSDFLTNNDDFDKLYMPYTSDQISFKSDDTIVNVDLDFDTVTDYITGTYFDRLSSYYADVPTVDPISIYTRTLARAYDQTVLYTTIPAEGIYTLNLTATSTYYDSSEPGHLTDTVTIYIKTIGDNLLVDQVTVNMNPGQSDSTGTSTIDYELLLDDKLYIDMKENGSLGDGTYDYHWEHRIDINLEIVPKETCPIYGFSVIKAANVLPDIDQAKFIKNFIDMYNLHIEKEPFTTNYIIEPREQYYALGTSLDWSDKIDLNSQKKLSYFNDLDIKNYIFKYDDGSDYQNTNYAEINDITFGEKQLEMDNDFSSSNRNITLPFAPTISKKVSGSYIWNVPVLAAEKDLGEERPDTNTEPRLLYKNNIYLGNYPEETFLYNNHTQDILSTLNHNDEILPSNTTFNDLNFETASEPQGGKITQNNLYNLYWNEYVNYINSKDTEVLTAYFNLTYLDYINLRFRDRIYIDYYKSWFILNNIVNYNIGDNSLTKLELIKEQVGGIGSANVDFNNLAYTCGSYFEGDTMTLSITATNLSDISIANVIGQITVGAESYNYNYNIAPGQSQVISHAFTTPLTTPNVTVDFTGSYVFNEIITVNAESGRLTFDNVTFATEGTQGDQMIPIATVIVRNNSCESIYSTETVSIQYDTGSQDYQTLEETLTIGGISPMSTRVLSFNSIQIPYDAPLGHQGILATSSLGFIDNDTIEILEYFTTITFDNMSYIMVDGYSTYEDELVNFTITLSNTGYKDVSAGEYLYLNYNGGTSQIALTLDKYETKDFYFTNIPLVLGAEQFVTYYDYGSGDYDIDYVSVLAKPSISTFTFTGTDFQRPYPLLMSTNITNGGVAATYYLDYSNSFDLQRIIRTITLGAGSTYSQNEGFNIGNGYGEDVDIYCEITREDGRELTSIDDVVFAEATEGDYEIDDFRYPADSEVIEGDTVVLYADFNNPGYKDFTAYFTWKWSVNILNPSEPYGDRIQEIIIPARAGYDSQTMEVSQTYVNAPYAGSQSMNDTDQYVLVSIEDDFEQGSGGSFLVKADRAIIEWGNNEELSFDPINYNWGTFPDTALANNYTFDNNGTGSLTGHYDFIAGDVDFTEPGIIDTAAYIDGSAGGELHSTASVSELMNGNIAGAMSFWLKLMPNPGTRYSIIGDVSAPGYEGFSFSYIDVAGTPQYLFDVNTGSVSNNLSAYGTWDHIVLNYDYGGIEVYVNGELSNYDQADPLEDSGNPTYIGQFVGGQDFTEMVMDELSIFDEPLTQDEVYDLFGGGKGNPYVNDTDLDVQAHIHNSGSKTTTGVSLRFDIENQDINYNDISTGTIAGGNTVIATTTFNAAELLPLQTQMTTDELLFSCNCNTMENPPLTITTPINVFNRYSYDYGAAYVSPVNPTQYTSSMVPTLPVKYETMHSSKSKPIWFSHSVNGTGAYVTKTATATISSASTYNYIHAPSFTWGNGSMYDINWTLLWDGTGESTANFFTFYMYDHAPDFSSGLDESYIGSKRYYPKEEIYLAFGPSTFSDVTIECDETGPLFNYFPASMRVVNYNTYTNNNVYLNFTETGQWNTSSDTATYSIAANGTQFISTPSWYWNGEPLMGLGDTPIISDTTVSLKIGSVPYDTRSVEVTYEYCLALDTMITLPDGSQVRIDSLNVGDEVMSFEVSGMIDEKEAGWSRFTYTGDTKDFSTGVTNIVVHSQGEYENYYNINNGFLKLTYEHPLWVKRDNIWMWQPTNLLQVKDLMIDRWGNQILIKSIEKIDEPLQVIKMDVESSDTYFASNVAVHNANK